MAGQKEIYSMAVDIIVSDGFDLSKDELRGKLVFGDHYKQYEKERIVNMVYSQIRKMKRKIGVPSGWSPKGKKYDKKHFEALRNLFI